MGECGLDYFRNLSPPEAQRRAFVAQLEIAVQVRKPVFLHQRDAHADFAAILQEFAGRTLTAAWRTASRAARWNWRPIWRLGLYIGITGWACDERRGIELRHSVPRIPADRLLIETDAPYLLPRDLKPTAQVTAQRALLPAAYRGDGRAPARGDARGRRGGHHAQRRDAICAHGFLKWTLTDS